MEEFTNKNTVGQDADVILATKKKVTLQPLHEDLQVDDDSDVQVAASHAVGPSIANIPSDRESTGETEATHTDVAKRVDDALAAHKASQPVDMTKRHAKSISIIGLLVVLAIALFALLYR